MGKKTAGLTAPSKSIDPTLDALFSTSAGPVEAPPKSRYSTLLDVTPREAAKKHASDASEDEDEDGDEEVLSEASQELDYDVEEDEDEGGSSSESSDKPAATQESEDEPLETTNRRTSKDNEQSEGNESKRERKRKRKDDNDDLEAKYFDKLIEDDDAEPAEKRQKANSDSEKIVADDDEDDAIPQHESLKKEEASSSEVEKANRTVFLANVSTTAISSKSAKRELLKHLSSVLDEEASPPEKVESIRFRSVAFSAGAMPKRAAYITQQLMEATTKSTNAYAVYSTPAAARKAATKLNGSEVLDRHIRVDSVAHPTPADHRRCVFVGNLGFVDDEAVLNTDGDGETVKKKRNKIPSDIEEGLWRTFSSQGAVENVRVVRDPKTRVGKGFAYVQFYDANSVESALHLEGKKFPPMLPRALRVTRAKDPRKTALAQERTKGKLNAAGDDAKNTKYKKKLTPEEKSMVGRAGKLLGRAGAAAQERQARGKKSHQSKSRFESRDGAANGMKTPEQVVFEGMRATAKNGRPNDLKFGKKKSKGKSGKPINRGTRRAAEWRKKQ